MKKKYWIVGGLLCVFAMACYFGGQSLSQYISDQRTDELQQETQPIETPDAPETAKPTVSIPPLSTEAVTYTPPVTKPSDSVTVREEEDGTLVVTPNWSSPPASSAAPTANMAGGGGDMNMVDDVYYGEKVDATPTPKASVPPPTSTPVATPKPSESGKPTEAPDKTPAPTPKPVEPSAQPTPTPTPEVPSGGGSTPPVDNGTHKDGDISPDGRYEYWFGFGWVDRTSTNGGTGWDDSDMITGGLSGEKIGEM